MRASSQVTTRGGLRCVPHVNRLMPGGQLRPDSFSLSGPRAVAVLQGLYADRQLPVRHRAGGAWIS